MPVKNKVTIKCDRCGKTIERYFCVIKKHNFCCRQCFAEFSNKSKNPEGYLELKDYSKMGEHFSRLNRALNPTRMTIETRQKLRASRVGLGNGVAYKKYFGVHVHRVVAEQILGRPLTDDEVVHHIDGDNQNNRPDNLRVFPSQSEHASYHAKLNVFFKKGGDAR